MTRYRRKGKRRMPDQVPRTTENTNDAPDNKDKGSERPQANIASDLDHNIHTEHQNHYSQKEHERWRVTTALTVVTALGAIFAAIFGWYQGWVARDTEIRSLRAYAFIETAASRNIVQGQKPGIQFNILDRGQTPASKVRTFGVVKVAPFPLPKEYDLTVNDVTENQVFVVYQNATLHPSGWIQATVPITDTEFIAVTSDNSGRGLYGYGHISYEDVFKVERQTRFCFWLDPKSIERVETGINKVVWAFCDRHNDFD